MRHLAILLVLCGLSPLTQAVLSTNVNWKYGDPGTTYQKWTFDTDSLTIAPEVDLNSYGDPMATLKASLFNPDLIWNGQGMWVGSNYSLTIDLPNNPVANPYKEVLVEIIYQGVIGLNWVKDNNWNDFQNIYSSDSDLGNGWMKRTDVWKILPNPLSERLCYGFKPAVTGAPAVLDSIEISTICIPEPLTLALLGMGILAVSRKK